MLRQGATGRDRKEGQSKAGKVQRWAGVTKARVWVTHPVLTKHRQGAWGAVLGQTCLTHSSLSQTQRKATLGLGGIAAQLGLCRDRQQVISSYKLEAQRTGGRAA